MGLAKAALIPIVSLSAICGIGLLFIAWWYPRMWASGTKSELEIRKKERIERDQYMAQLRAREAAVGSTSASEAGDAANHAPPPVATEPAAPKSAYRPPVAGLG